MAPHPQGNMRVALSVIGKFHTFDLAREMHARASLVGIYSGYPRFKLRQEMLPQALIHTFPWLQTPYLAMPRKDRLGTTLVRHWEYLTRVTFDAHVARHLPPCDVFVGLSSSALRSGRRAHQMGARYVCDRGSTHIRVQNELLRQEHERWGLPYQDIDARTVALEEAEYAEADLITIPSSFNKRSFLQQGVSEHKLKVLPYGVNLTRFQPVAKPQSGEFNVLFVGAMSIRKGVGDLISAFKQVVHPRKSLTFVGSAPPDMIATLTRAGLWSDAFKVMGHVPQEKLKDIMSRAHVKVLPSIEEGLALVQAQAMACACPVIATSHTGAEDLFEDGVQGFIVPIRSPLALAEKMQLLADSEELRDQMGQQALLRVQRAGGWQQYGQAAYAAYESLIAA